jgi:predicted Zn-dependent peptidase
VTVICRWLLVGLLASPVAAALPLELARLANGVRIVAARDDAAAGCTLQLWCGAGSADDPAAQGGLAATAGQVLLAAVRSAAGDAVSAGQAGTLRDATWMALATELNELPSASESLAAVLADPDSVRDVRVPSADGVASVGEEWERLVERLAPAAAGRSGGAAAQEPGAATDAAAFVQKWFAPGNLTVVVAGPHPPRELIEAVEPAFERLEWREYPRRPARPATQPADIGRSVTPGAVVLLAWSGPAADDASGPAIDVLLAWLTDPMAGPLAAATDKLGLTRPAAARHAFRSGGVIVVAAMGIAGAPVDAVAVAKLRQRLEAALRERLEMPLTPVQLNRARALAWRQDRAVFDAPAARAWRLGFAAVVGRDAFDGARHAEDLLGVSASEVQAAARDALAATQLAVPASDALVGRAVRVGPALDPALRTAALPSVKRTDRLGADVELEFRPRPGAVVTVALVREGNIPYCAPVVLAPLRPVPPWTLDETREYLAYHAITPEVEFGEERVVLRLSGSADRAAQMTTLLGRMLAVRGPVPTPVPESLANWPASPTGRPWHLPPGAWAWDPAWADAVRQANQAALLAVVPEGQTRIVVTGPADIAAVRRALDEVGSGQPDEDGD